jgi:uncharacterized protein YwgA
MTRYQLAKLVSWAGRVDARKRLQKVVYLLQAAGCPLEADFFLHHYGPYSQDVARLTDEMVRANLLREEEEPLSQGSRYSYRLPESVEEQLSTSETTPHGKHGLERMEPFESIAKRLFHEDLRMLEYASTIVYFHQQTNEWQEAVAKAERFKGTSAVRSALSIAQESVRPR